MEFKTYKINEIFSSVQGEGAFTGTQMIFVRFAGCNLACSWCDTAHEKTNLKLTANEIVSAIIKEGVAKRVCLTGGEPTLQVDKYLIGRLVEAGFKIHMETNGTKKPDYHIDWLVVSPKILWHKKKFSLQVTECDELKVVFEKGVDYNFNILHKVKYIQPLTAVNGVSNIKDVLDYVKLHPDWRISMQMQKIWEVR